jgi:hypothetical protein
VTVKRQPRQRAAIVAEAYALEVRAVLQQRTARHVHGAVRDEVAPVSLLAIGQIDREQQIVLEHARAEEHCRAFAEAQARRNNQTPRP